MHLISDSPKKLQIEYNNSTVSILTFPLGDGKPQANQNNRTSHSINVLRQEVRK